MNGIHNYRDLISSTSSVPKESKTNQNPKYVPLKQALELASVRVRDALISLSIVEIRTALSATQVSDTANEVTSAVKGSVDVHRLFISEVKGSEMIDIQDKVQLRSLLQERSDPKITAGQYQEITTRLMDSVRSVRAYAPPTVNANSILVTPPKTVNILVAKIDDAITSEKALMVKKKYKMRKIAGF